MKINSLINKNQNTFFKRFFLSGKNIFVSYLLIFILILVWLFFTITTKGRFISSRNLSNLFRQMSILGFLTMGMMPVIITGNVDLSPGTLTGYISIFAASVQSVIFSRLFPMLFPSFNQHILFFGMETAITMNGLLSTFFTIFFSIIIGVSVGLYQGSLIAYLGLPSLLVTFANLYILGGVLAFVAFGATFISIEKSLLYLGQGYASKEFGIIIGVIGIILIFLFMLWDRRQKKIYNIKRNHIFIDILKAFLLSSLIVLFIMHIANGYRGLPVSTFIMIVVVIIFSHILTNTKFSRHCFALGGSRETAKFSGVNVKKNIIMVYVLSGFMASLAGIILTGYLSFGSFSNGIFLTFSAIAACMIGLIGFKHGEGIILGAIIGALLIESVDNWMVLMDYNPDSKGIIKGIILIISVFIASKRGSNVYKKIF